MEPTNNIWETVTRILVTRQFSVSTNQRTLRAMGKERPPPSEPLSGVSTRISKFKSYFRSTRSTGAKTTMFLLKETN